MIRSPAIQRAIRWQRDRTRDGRRAQTARSRPVHHRTHTQHALETADTKRLADLIEGFLDSDNRAMRNAFILGVARSQTELTPTQYASALQRIRDQLDDSPPG